MCVSPSAVWMWDSFVESFNGQPRDKCLKEFLLADPQRGA